MTAPGNFTAMTTRSNAQALMPEQVSNAARTSEGRRQAAGRASVGADGKVHAGGKHVGHVYRSGKAWRARTKGGQLPGLHATKQEAIGALVLHAGA
jgi:hypothetical protein